MKNKYIVLFFLFLLSFVQKIVAHSYIPEKGETFVFYPVTDANKRNIPGFYTKEMCREAWGSPWDINYTTYSWGDYEQWCYQNGSYLYFKNGILTSIQIL